MKTNLQNQIRQMKVLNKLLRRKKVLVMVQKKFISNQKLFFFFLLEANPVSVKVPGRQTKSGQKQ